MTELTGSFYFIFFFLPVAGREIQVGLPWRCWCDSSKWFSNTTSSCWSSRTEAPIRAVRAVRLPHLTCLRHHLGSSGYWATRKCSSRSKLPSSNRSPRIQQPVPDRYVYNTATTEFFFFFLYRIFMKMWLMVDRFRLVRARRLLRHPSADRTAKAKWRKKIWMLADSLTVRSARREPWLANTSGWARGPARPRCTPWGSKYRSASVWNSSRNPSRPHPPSHPPLQPRKTDRNSKVEPNDLPVRKRINPGCVFSYFKQKKSNFHVAFAESLPDQKWPIF